MLLCDVLDILDSVPYHLGNTGLLLGHSQKTIGAHDSTLVVRDDDELTLLIEFVQYPHEGTYVMGIKRSINLVKYTERRRFDHICGKQERYGSH